MIVEQIWTANAYRNFNYLIVCPETGEALAIDPLDHRKCLARAKDKGWDITQILNTHEHGDHIGGNSNLRRAGDTVIGGNMPGAVPYAEGGGAQVIAHENVEIGRAHV